MKNKDNVLEEISKMLEIHNEDIQEFSLDGEIKIAKLVDIYDADTCKIIFIMDGKIVKFNCRLNNIDAPEMRPSRKNPNRIYEKIAAKKARNRFIQLSTNIDIDINEKLDKETKKNLLKSNKKFVKVKCKKFDKYGRLLIDIYTLDKNIHINNKMIEEGIVKPYSGGKKETFDNNIDIDTESD